MGRISVGAAVPLSMRFIVKEGWTGNQEGQVAPNWSAAGRIGLLPDGRLTRHREDLNWVGLVPQRAGELHQHETAEQ